MRGADAAPTIVARGSGLAARKMISLARKHGVPLREDRNLIEILSTIDPSEEMPTERYKAVAEIRCIIYEISGGLESKKDP